MPHVPDAKLRRLTDEPLGVADADTTHVARCNRCRMRHQRIRSDAAYAKTLMSRPHPVPDVDSAWVEYMASREEPRTLHVDIQAPRRRAIGIPIPTVRAFVGGAVVVAAAVLAGTLGAVLSPLSSVPQQATIQSSSFNGIEDLVDIGGGDPGTLGGFKTSSGTVRLPFGRLTWSSVGNATRSSSLSAAKALTGIDVRTPSKRPAGVGGISKVFVQPEVTATIEFDSRAGSLSGTSLTVRAGPAVLVEYGGKITELGLPALATFTMVRPTVSSGSISSGSTSSGASTTAQLEAYVLSAHGVPSGLEQELRLFGDVTNVLPVEASTGSGANVTQVDIDGAAGILVTAPSVGASGAIWQSHGVLNAAFGLLDEQDLLNVAEQVG
jgi:hypothetical protein